MSSVILSGFPMPPQSNNLYVTDRRSGRRYPSGDLKKFVRDMGDWRKVNLQIANAARAALVAIDPANQLPIRVDRYFAFHRGRIVTLDGAPQRMDASNRIKAFDDCLAELVLGIDDKWVFSGYEEKVIAAPEEPESVMIVLTHMRLKTLAELEALDPSGVPVALAATLAMEAAHGLE